MTATFSPPVNPSVQPQRTLKFRRWTAQLGDGYRQDVVNGINATIETWNLKWDALLAADFNTINSFLVGTKGVTAFYWTPPFESTPKKYKLMSISDSADTCFRTLNCTIEQVFDP